MHTILGAGGTIANALAAELLKNGEKVRLLSRRPVKMEHPLAEWQRADLMNSQDTIAVGKGASVIYICNGVGNQNEDWQRMWPVIMDNCIRSAKENGARLIFLDNIYMYGPVNGKMTEETAYNPTTIKGEVRARISRTFIDAISRGEILGATARAGGFYGTDNSNSVLDTLVLGKFAAGKKASWIGKVDLLHNFTFIPDCGRALFVLGQNPKGDGQVWHIPTARPQKGRDLIRLAAEIYGVEPRFSTLNQFSLKLAGLFNSNAKSISEMYYQYARDYDFDSSKFEKAFGVAPTSFREGIQLMSQTHYPKAV